MKHQLTQASRSRSQQLITEDDLKKLFPFTQQQHNRYLAQNRLESVQISNEHKRSISSHIKELLLRQYKQNLRDKKPRQLQPMAMLDDINKSRESKKRTLISYHDSQNVNLHNQNQRREMVQLAQWLDIMVEQLQGLGLTDYQDYYNRLEVIYSGSVLELERQISSLGYEFGQFLKRIWETFVQQVQKTIKLNKKVQVKLIDFINGIRRLQRNRHQQMQDMKDEVYAVQSAIERLKRENIYLRKKEKRREKQYEDQFYLDRKSQIINLFNEEQLDVQYQQKEIFEFFRKKYDEQRKVLEQGYHAMVMQDEFYEMARDIIVVENSVDTSDLIKHKDYQSDTSEYFTTNTTYTQTPKKARTFDVDIQAQPYNINQETQVKRVPRNLIEQKLFKKSKIPLHQIIEEYQDLYFPENELQKNDPNYLHIVESQFNQMNERAEEIVSLINLRSEIQSEDVYTLKEYNQKQLKQFHEFFKNIWFIAQQQVSSIIDSRIDKEELEMDIHDMEKRFEENIILYKRFHQKFKEKEGVSKFYEQSLVKVLRFAPQFLINSVRDQAQQMGVLQHVEFKEMKKRANTNTFVRDKEESSSPTKASDRDSPPTNKRGSVVIQNNQIAMKFVGNLKKVKESQENELKDDDDYKSESESQKSSESDFSVSHLKMELNTKKPTLTLEKKLRIANCPVKSAIYSTNVLKQVLGKFNQNNRSGLYKVTTMAESYQQIVFKTTNTQTNTPYHVHLYESIFSTLWCFVIQSIRSFLFYESKNVTCKLATRFLKADLDVQDFNIYLNIIQDVQEYPQSTYQRIIQSIVKFLQSVNYDQQEIDQLVNEIPSDSDLYLFTKGQCDVDLVMNSFLTVFQKYKNRTNIKYKHLFSAVDYKKKGSITFQQWQFIYEAFYPNSYQFSVKCFYKEADYHDDEGKMMSMQRFTLVSDELNIFQPSGLEQIYGQYTNEWNRERVMMKMQYIKASRYDRFIKSLFTLVDGYIQNQQSLSAEKVIQTYAFGIYVRIRNYNRIITYKLNIQEN
ncbi:hypothetical protein pb186bvf_015044 [Paramecium bursaria]